VKVLFLPDYTSANAYQGELATALRARGVTVVAQPTGRRRIAPVLQAVRRHGRPDVLHLHWTEPYISGGRADVSRLRVTRTLAELRLLRRAGSRIVWTAHDLARHDREPDPLEIRFNRSLFALCGAVIVHCEAAREALVQALALPGRARARVRVIPHGHYEGAYPDTVSRTEARQRLGLPVAGVTILFVGWVRPYKGVRELVEAFRSVRSVDARLFIAGQPGSEAFRAEIATLAATDDRVVTRFGFVPDDELQVYLKAADVVALPYREIFTSGSVLLAMTFGRAVIAPRRGCIGETLDDAGALLYDANDPTGLADALGRALTADLEGMGAHNRARLPEFGWDRIADATLETYEAAMS
jgi:glycosyltransferase involved in cell wall biosynthesis